MTPKCGRIILLAIVAIQSQPANAQLGSAGILDQTAERFEASASIWANTIMNHATFLFYTLGAISLTFTFGMMVLRRADIGEFFAEFIRFIIFFGFFLWLLRNGPEFANSIMKSLATIGAEASGTTAATPSSIVDHGFTLIDHSLKNLSIWDPIDSAIGFILSVIILIMLSAIAINLLLLFITSWILSYAGIIFLGFGGSRESLNKSVI